MSWVESDIELEAARQASRAPEFAAAAREIQAAVKTAAPKDTGTFAASIVMTTHVTPRGVHDRVITSLDEAAVPIEFGFTSPNGNRTPGHHVFGKVAHAFKDRR